MSDQSYVTVNGFSCTRCALKVANIGPWVASVDFTDAPDVAGAVTLQIGTLSLKGTIVNTQDGTFGSGRRSRIVGGAAGWRKLVTPKGYHSDAGVRAQLVASDVAREVGETLGGFVPSAERLGTDYVRQAGPAVQTLEDAIGVGVAWWVDYNGVTQAGPRPAAPVAASAYELLAYDPRGRVATLALEDPAAVVVGSELSERLDSVQTVREFELVVDADKLRVKAWMGGAEGEAGRLAALLRGIIRRATDGQVNGTYRYRVVRMAPDGRVELQAVRRVVGLPDILPISQWPGASGVHSELTPGAVVLVNFIEGDRTMPVVVHYPGKDSQGFSPVSMDIGDVGGSPAARLGDAVEVLLPPATLNGTAIISGVPTPITGVLSFLMPKAEGQVTSGSAKVRIA